MHDSGWLIFAFPSKMEMLDILGGGPYYVFGRPLILKVMLIFFLFSSHWYDKNIDLGKIPKFASKMLDSNLPFKAC